MPSGGPQITAKLSLDPAAFERNLIRVVVMTQNAATKVSRFRFSIATAGIKAATAALRGMAATIASIGKGGLSGMGASFLVGGWTGIGGAIAGITQKMTAGVDEVYDYARGLEILSRNTGFSTKSLSIFKVAMEDTGVTMELFQRTSRMIAKDINLGLHGDQAATAGFEQIGLHVRDLMKMKPEEQFLAVGSAIAALKNPTMQAAAAVSRFGSESAKMLSFFKNKDALGIAEEAVGKQAEIYERSGKTFERLSVRISHIAVKIRGFFAGVGEAIMPMMDRLTAIFHRMDFSSWGTKIGSAINRAMAWLVTFWNNPEKTMGYFWEYAKVEVMELGNLLVNMAVLFGEALANQIAAATKGMIMNFVGGGPAMAMMLGGKGQQAAPTLGAKDHFGASDARTKLAAMRPTAAFEAARATLGQNPAAAPGAPVPTSWRLAGMGTFGSMGGIGDRGAKFGGGAIRGASMAGGLARLMELNSSPGMRDTASLSGMHPGAYGQSNLLKHAELRKYRNARVAMGLEQRHPGETANGDRQRAKAVAVELERKKQHAGSSEQLLSDIASYTDEVAKNTAVFRK